MKISDAFPSNYLKASDFEGDTLVTIKGVTMEEIGQGKQKEMKAIVHFDEFEKGLVLNVTNKNAIEGLYGDETDDWIGKPITLFPTEVEFAGEQVMAIRVRLRKPVAVSKTAAPTGSDVNLQVLAAKDKALLAFRAAHEGESQEEKKAAWVSLLRRSVPGKHPDAFTISDWEKVRLSATPPPEPFSDADDSLAATADSLNL